MTGARPDTIGVIENTAYFRDLNPEIVTLPQHLIANGYETVYCGKIYHAKMTDHDLSWSRGPAWKSCRYQRQKLPGSYALPENQKIWQENREAMLAKYGPNGSGGLVLGRSKQPMWRITFMAMDSTHSWRRIGGSHPEEYWQTSVSGVGAGKAASWFHCTQKILGYV